MILVALCSQRPGAEESVVYGVAAPMNRVIAQRLDPSAEHRGLEGTGRAAGRRSCYWHQRMRRAKSA